MRTKTYISEAGFTVVKANGYKTTGYNLEGTTTALQQTVQHHDNKPLSGTAWSIV